MKDVRDALMIGHDSDGNLVRRPLSPHLQVYTPQLTSILSIMNRVTGIAVSVGTLMMVWWLVAASRGPDSYATVSGFMRSPVGLFVLFGWTAALFWHFFGGIRHLTWDAGYGYDLPQTHASGWTAVIATVASTVLVWAAALWMLRS